MSRALCRRCGALLDPVIAALGDDEHPLCASLLDGTPRPPITWQFRRPNGETFTVTWPPQNGPTEDEEPPA